jgi:hypothetical protein
MGAERPMRAYRLLAPWPVVSFRQSSDAPLPTVRSALDAGCQVDALCLSCDRVSRLDLARRIKSGGPDLLVSGSDQRIPNQRRRSCFNSLACFCGLISGGYSFSPVPRSTTVIS